MKTAISLSENLFYLVDKYAKKHGLSRNQLCETAISDFLQRRQKKEIKNITQKIDSVCEDVDTTLDPQISIASRRMLMDAEW